MCLLYMSVEQQGHNYVLCILEVELKKGVSVYKGKGGKNTKVEKVNSGRERKCFGRRLIL